MGIYINRWRCDWWLTTGPWAKERCMYGAFFFYFNKAFDTVPHHPLLEKLQKFHDYSHFTLEKAVCMCWWSIIKHSVCIIWVPQASVLHVGPQLNIIIDNTSVPLTVHLVALHLCRSHDVVSNCYHNCRLCINPARHSLALPLDN